MLIEKDLIIEIPQLDTVDVLPRGSGCFQNLQQGHRFLLRAEVAPFVYSICYACGAVRIEEKY
jgi:hypothetical protein